MAISRPVSEFLTPFAANLVVKSPVVMVLQVGHRYLQGSTQSAPSRNTTVPVTVAIMVLMSILRLEVSPGSSTWGLKSTLEPGRATFAMLTPADDGDRSRGGGISWVTWGLGLFRVSCRGNISFEFPSSGTAISECSCPPCGLPSLGAHDRQPVTGRPPTPAKMVSAVFGGTTTSILVLLMVLHGPIATNILNVYSAGAGGAQAWASRLSRATPGWR